MRPKLKPDTYYLPIPNGVVIRNSRSSLQLKGQLVSQWIEKLVPYLNGRYTLEEIIQGLEPDKKRWVSELLNMLQARSFLKDVSLDRPHTLNQCEEEAYAPALAYIDTFQESAAYRFECFCAHRVLVIGSGLTCTSLVSAILASGVRQLAVLTTEECATNTARYQEFLDLVSKSASQQMVTEIDSPEWQSEEAVSELLKPFDTILHVSDRPMLTRARLLNRLCMAQKKLLIQAMPIDTTIWLGPLVDGTTSGCWECAWLRLQTHSSGKRDAFVFKDGTTHPISHTLALPTATLVANLLSFELFKYCTAAGPQRLSGNMMRIDLATLDVQQHSFLRHPLCDACASPDIPSKETFLEHMHNLQKHEPLDPDLFLKRSLPCFEEHLGLFSQFGISGYAAVPLRFCQTTMSQPIGSAISESPLLLTEVGQTFYRARRKLTKRACEVYAANLVDHRRLVSTERAYGTEGPTRKITPAILGESEAFTDVQQWSWALHLQTGEPCLIPASLVFPVLHNQIPQSESGLGIASGMEWAEAVCQGLLNWCQVLTLGQIGKSGQPYPQVDLTTMPLQGESTRQDNLISLVEDTMRVYDVTGSLQVPTFAFCFADRTIAYSTHMDANQAFVLGLEKYIHQYQAIKDHKLPLLPEVSMLPLALRSGEVRAPSYLHPAGWQARQAWLLEKLQGEGWQAFAIPLDHDPALAEILPFVVHVLLARTQN